jgi:hypothetical protein
MILKEKCLVVQTGKEGQNKGVKTILKSWKVITIGISVTLLAFFSIMLVAGIEGGYRDYYMTLTHSGSLGDCYCSERYVNVVLLGTGLVSSTPEPYSIAVGYIVNPNDWGSGVYTVLHAPGWGPAATYGSYYAVWGNLASNDETTHGITRYLWP